MPIYGYTGRERDATGLTFYRARYYHPGIARFTSRDPMGMADAISSYAYVGNSPTNFVDPWGLAAMDPVMLADASGLKGYWGTVTGAAADFWQGFVGSAPLSSDASTSTQLGRGTRIAVDYGLIAVDVLNSVVSPTPDVGLIGAAGITARSVAKEAAEGAGSAAAKAGAAAIDANKFAHIFGNAQHDLGALVRKIGSQEATFTAVQGATQAAVKGQGLSGVFQTTVTVAGQNVVVKGNLIDDIARIGTFFIP